MAALFGSMVVNELGVGFFGPASGRLILLAGEDGYCDRDLHTFSVEEAALVFPIETRREDPGIRQPVKRDVVENLVPRQLAGGARSAVQSRNDRGGGLAVGVIVIEKPGREENRGICQSV